MVNEFVQAGVWILLPFGLGLATGMVAMAMAITMMRGDEEEMECEKCKVVEMCKRMFGKYWEDKSDGGRGCKWPPKEKRKSEEELQQALDGTPRAPAESTGCSSAARTSWRQEEQI